MSSAPKYTPSYDVNDYALWEGEWELWNGTAVSMSPSPFAEHGALLVRMATAIENAVVSADCNASTLAETDWIVSKDTVVRPDLSVVCGGPPKKHIVEPPALVVEVLSAGTRERDLSVKRELYQQYSVNWYIIVDPENSSLTVLQLDSAGTYQPVEPQAATATRICESCLLQVDLSNIFRKSSNHE